MEVEGLDDHRLYCYPASPEAGLFPLFFLIKAPKQDSFNGAMMAIYKLRAQQNLCLPCGLENDQFSNSMVKGKPTIIFALLCALCGLEKPQSKILLAKRKAFDQYRLLK